MKLATLHDGSRDGQLVVVSRDLSTAHRAAHIAGTLQQVLDDWNFISPQLEDLYATLNGGKARHGFAFDLQRCLAPLPRAHLWVAAGRLARSDAFLRPAGLAPTGLEGLQPCWQWVAVTGDMPAGEPGADMAAGSGGSVAADGVRLLTLALTWVNATPELPAGAATGAVRATAFAPLVATPDELGPAWAGARSPAAWAERVAWRRGARLHPGPAGPEAAETAPDSPGLGLGAALHRLTCPRWSASAAAGFGLGAGSLVGGRPVAAGPVWGPGDRIELQAQGVDGHSLVGMLSLCSADPAARAAEAAGQAVPEAADAPAAGEGTAP